MNNEHNIHCPYERFYMSRRNFISLSRISTSLANSRLAFKLKRNKLQFIEAGTLYVGHRSHVKWQYCEVLNSPFKELWSFTSGSLQINRYIPPSFQSPSFPPPSNDDPRPHLVHLWLLRKKLYVYSIQSLPAVPHEEELKQDIQGILAHHTSTTQKKQDFFTPSLTNIYLEEKKKQQRYQFL